MQPTWLETFHEQTDLNQYPIALRTRGGIGYRKPNGETVSNFVGHPVHYFEGGLWKPITLQPHANGDFEGSDFSWRGKQVFYKGKTIFEPKAVIFNGVRHNLFLRQDGNRIVSDLNFEGSAAQYEVIFSEKGVKELLTIFEPVNGLLEFDTPRASKPDGLFKKERHIVGKFSQFGETFQLTDAMTYPIRVDPNYDAQAADGYVYGSNATYATARSTSTDRDVGTADLWIYQDTSYLVMRSFLKFSTSGIPDSDVISAVEMSLYCLTKTTTSSWNVQIVKQDWSAQDPIGAGNREAAYDNALTATLDDNIWKGTSSITAGNRYSSGALATSWVSKTGSTYYSLVNSRDRSNTAPTATEEITVASQDHGTAGNRPYLTVTHAAGNNANFFRMF